MGKCIYLRKGETHTLPAAGIKASDLPIGQIVKLMEGGVETEFIVVNQGNPDTSLYDESCNGTWLLRKDIKEDRVWGATNDYQNSSIHTYLNGDYLDALNVNARKAVLQVKIPYRNGTGNSGSTAYGTNGLNTKIFLLSDLEIGFTANMSDYIAGIGSNLSYFIVGSTAEANNQRIATKASGNASPWNTRVPYVRGTSAGSTSVWYSNENGVAQSQSCTGNSGVRPALILPSTSIFDSTTYLLKK